MLARKKKLTSKENTRTEGDRRIRIVERRSITQKLSRFVWWRMKRFLPPASLLHLCSKIRSPSSGFMLARIASETTPHSYQFAPAITAKSKYFREFPEYYTHDGLPIDRRDLSCAINQTERNFRFLPPRIACPKTTLTSSTCHAPKVSSFAATASSW